MYLRALATMSVIILVMVVIQVFTSFRGYGVPAVIQMLLCALVFMFATGMGVLAREGSIERKIGVVVSVITFVYFVVIYYLCKKGD